VLAGILTGAVSTEHNSALEEIWRIRVDQISPMPVETEPPACQIA
jgi:hypothetical protein